MSNSSSNTGNSLARLTIVARSAARNASRSASPVTSDALNASSVSASETRTPFSRSRLANSTSFSCMVLRRPTLVRSIQKIFVAAGFGAPTRADAAHVVLEFFLRFAHVTLVLHDCVERLGHELLIEAVHVQQRQRLDPIDRLTDAGTFLQIHFAQRSHTTYP